VLLVALLISGCATAAAGTGLPSSASAASYRSLYLGLEGAGLGQPPLLAETTISTLEADFPPPSAARLQSELKRLGPELYLGITLARLSCRDDYLAQVSYGPGAVVTLTVVQRQLPPGAACFELIGPVRYQVVALPLRQFPGRLRLSIMVNRPSGTAGNRASVRLP